MVYVINKDGEPLMPCKEAKARKLLRSGLAKVVQRTPFTIQLTYETSNYTQPITLGVDAGSKVIGLSATTEKQELYVAEIKLRDDIVELLSTKRQYRRTKRNRLRYRKARFNNRKRKDKWLAPSVQHKIDSHLRVIHKLHKILPITKIIVEVASFDIQKIKNPYIQGVEYQQGEQLYSWNVREYVLFRDGHKCQAKKGCKNKILNVHHIVSRKIGGDAPNNQITLCIECHKTFHGGELELKIKRGQSFRNATFMGIMRWSFYNKLKELYNDVSLTYGYITKSKRIDLKLDKNHSVDAYCISGNTKAKRSNVFYEQKFVRKNNRSLHKANLLKGGIRKANKAPYIVHGFRLFDKVRFKGKDCFVFGRRLRGGFDIRMLDGTKISASANYKKLKLVEVANTLLTNRKKVC